MITRKEADKIVDTVLDYFKMNIDEISLGESIELNNRVYHAAGVF